MPGAVHVHGLVELAAALRACEPGLRRELNAALKRGVAPAVSHARATAPVSSGKFAASIGARARRTGASFGSPLPYAGVLEWARTVKVSGGKVAPHTRSVSPQPTLEPAAEATLPEVEREVATGIQALLDTLVGSQ